MPPVFNKTIVLGALFAAWGSQVSAQENFVGEVPLDTGYGTGTGALSQDVQGASAAAAAAVVVAQSDGSAVTSGESASPTGKRESEIDETVNTLDQYPLPRSAAPVAVDTNLRTGSPIGANTQAALTRPPGVKVDSASGFFPSLTIGVSWTDNPARSSDPIAQETDDTVYTIAPALVYRNSIKNRHAYELGVRAYSDSYDTFSNLDADSIVYSAAINLDMTEILMTDLYYSHTDSNDPRGATATRVIDPLADNDEFTRDTVGARVTVGRRSNTFQLVVGGQYDDIDYTNNNQDTRDREDTTFDVGLFWNTSPRTSLFTRARYRDIDYLLPISSGFDSEETYLTVGAGWEPTFNTSVIFEVGTLEKELANPAAEDYDEITYTGRLSWSPTRSTNVGFFASRRTEESIDFQSPFIESTLFGVNLNHSFTDRVRGGVYANFIEDDLVNVREDEILDYGLRFYYDWTRWLTLGAGWSHQDRDSTDPSAEYDSDTVSITASFYTPRPVSFGSLQTSEQRVFGY